MNTEEFPGPTPAQFPSMGLPFLAPVTNVGVPVYLHAFNGDQTAAPGQPYPLPLVARVINRIGRPLSNITVQFSSGQSAISNAEGWVTVSALSPVSGGPVAITATAGAARAIFRLGAPAAPAASITILQGQGQLVRSGQNLLPLRVAVHDASGNPVPGQDVTFSAPNGAAELECPGRRLCNLRTDGSGTVSVAMKLGSSNSEPPFEQQQIEIASGTAPRRTVFLTVGSIERHFVPASRTTFSGFINTTIPNALEFQFHEQALPGFYRPLANVGIAYRPPTAFPDLTCDGESGVVLAGADGFARCTLALGGQAGVAPLSAGIRVGGGRDDFAPVDSATVTILNTGQPRIEVLSGAQQVLRDGQPFVPISIRLFDPSGVPLPNVSLRWSVDASSGPSLVLDSPSAVTDGSGQGSTGLKVFWFNHFEVFVRVRALGTEAVIPIYVAASGDIPFEVTPPMPGFAGFSRFRMPLIGPWTIEGLPGWLRVRPAAGVGPGFVWFEHEANPSFTASRFATLTVGSRRINVEQAPRPRPLIQGGSITSSSGSSASIQVNFAGWSELRTLNVLNLLIRDSLDGRNACYVAYSMPSRVLYLVSDQGPETLSAPIALPSPQTVSNSQCTIHGAESSIRTSDNSVALTLRVSFSSSFAGAKLVYAGATDVFGTSSGWSITAVHSVPGPPTWPRPLSVTQTFPAFGSGTTFEFEDATDARNLETVWVLANTALDAAGACYFAYHVPSNQIFLFPDSGLASGIISAALEGGTLLSNTSCRIHTAGASVSKSGPNLRLTLVMSAFQPYGTPTRAVWLAAQSLSGQRSTWQALAVGNPY
jgi:hypothetical protein